MRENYVVLIVNTINKYSRRIEQMYDSLDIIKNVESIYNSDTAFTVLKDYERVLDDLDLYVYDNWENGELCEGPKIDRHWVTCCFMWPRNKMPDPMGGKRLTDYDCKVKYKKSDLVVPRKIESPEDYRPGTKKGKLDRLPIWMVEIQIPKSLLAEIYGGALEKTVLDPANQITAQQEAQPADEVAAPEAEAGAVA
ncbi:MAG: hypothetical protein VW551_00785 [Euryarchaeota archaeon]|jgi:hypothetical protein